MNKIDYRYGIYQRSTFKDIARWGDDLLSQLYLDCDKIDIKTNSEAKKTYRIIMKKIRQIKRLTKKECEVITQ